MRRSFPPLGAAAAPLPAAVARELVELSSSSDDGGGGEGLVAKLLEEEGCCEGGVEEGALDGWTASGPGEHWLQLTLRRGAALAYLGLRVAADPASPARPREVCILRGDSADSLRELRRLCLTPAAASPPASAAPGPPAEDPALSTEVAPLLAAVTDEAAAPPPGGGGDDGGGGGGLDTLVVGLVEESQEPSCKVFRLVLTGGPEGLCVRGLQVRCVPPPATAEPPPTPGPASAAVGGGGGGGGGEESPMRGSGGSAGVLASATETENGGILRRVDVSTNKTLRKYLTDGREDTFWLEPGAVVTGIAIQINNGDGNYCPSLVDVLVGDGSPSLRRMRTCSLTPSGNQRCVLVEKVRWRKLSMLQINIKENNGGCDCKVRGIFITGLRAPPGPPASQDALAPSRLLEGLLATAVAVAGRPDGSASDADDLTTPRPAAGACATGLASARRSAWVQELLAVLALPGYGAAARASALALLLRLACPPPTAAAADGGAEAAAALAERRELAAALCDALCHTSAAAAAARPLSPAHYAPCRALHARLVAAVAGLAARPDWGRAVLQVLEASLARLAAVAAAPSSLPPGSDHGASAGGREEEVADASAPATVTTTAGWVRLEVWWAGEGGGSDAGLSTAATASSWRPRTDSQPRAVLVVPSVVAATAAEKGLGEATWLALGTAVSSGVGRSTAREEYVVDAVDTPGQAVWLRRRPSPAGIGGGGRGGSCCVVTAERRAIFDLAARCRREGRSLEIITQASGGSGGGRRVILLPVDRPLFIRIWPATAPGNGGDILPLPQAAAMTDTAAYVGEEGGSWRLLCEPRESSGADCSAGGAESGCDGAAQSLAVALDCGGGVSKCAEGRGCGSPRSSGPAAESLTSVFAQVKAVDTGLGGAGRKDREVAAEDPLAIGGKTAEECGGAATAEGCEAAAAEEEEGSGEVVRAGRKESECWARAGVAGSPSVEDLPALLVLGELAAWPAAQPALTRLFRLLLQTLAALPPLEAPQPLGLRVVRSRAVRAALHALASPDCLAALLPPPPPRVDLAAAAAAAAAASSSSSAEADASGEEVEERLGSRARAALLALAARPVRGLPPGLGAGDLAARSASLCPMLAAVWDTRDLITPREPLRTSASAPPTSESARPRRIFETSPWKPEELAACAGSGAGGADGGEEVEAEEAEMEEEGELPARDAEEEEEEDDEIERAAKDLVRPQLAIDEPSLLTPLPRPRDTAAAATTGRSRRPGRPGHSGGDASDAGTAAAAGEAALAVGNSREGLLAEAAAVEDALAVSNARLCVLALLLRAPPGAVLLPPDALAALLRRLYRASASAYASSSLPATAPADSRATGSGSSASSSAAASGSGAAAAAATDAEPHADRLADLRRALESQLAAPPLQMFQLGSGPAVELARDSRRSPTAALAAPAAAVAPSPPLRAPAVRRMAAIAVDLLRSIATHRASAVAAAAAKANAAHAVPPADSAPAAAAVSSGTGGGGGGGGGLGFARVCVESRHNYSSAGSRAAVRVRVPTAAAPGGLRVELDPRCCTRRGRDFVRLFAGSDGGGGVGVVGRVAHGPLLHGPSGAASWPTVAPLPGGEVTISFDSEEGGSEWGFRVYLTPLDAHGREIPVSSFIVESAPLPPPVPPGPARAGASAGAGRLPSSARGKLMIMVVPVSAGGGGSPMAGGDGGGRRAPAPGGLRISFRSLGEADGGAGAGAGGRLKISAGTVKQVYQGAPSSWQPLTLPRSLQFTMEVKANSRHRSSRHSSPASATLTSLVAAAVASPPTTSWAPHPSSAAGGSGGAATTGLQAPPLSFAFTVEPLPPCGGGAGGTAGGGAWRDEEAEEGAGGDAAFAAWLAAQIGAPSADGGLLARAFQTAGTDCGGQEAGGWAAVHSRLVEALAAATRAAPPPQQPSMLRALALALRGLREAHEHGELSDGGGGGGGGVDFGGVGAGVRRRLLAPADAAEWPAAPTSFLSGLRSAARRDLTVLREAAMLQYAAESAAAGGGTTSVAAAASHHTAAAAAAHGRVQFSSHMQALAEAAAAADAGGGAALDLTGWSRAELLRAVEALDGPACSALCRAALAGRCEDVVFCLARGAAPAAPGPLRLVSCFGLRQYPLHYAAFGGDVSVVRLLLDHSADVHCMDSEGVQPLGWAAWAGRRAAAAELLCAGADPLHLDALNRTALALARCSQQTLTANSSAAPAARERSNEPDPMGLQEVVMLLEEEERQEVGASVGGRSGGGFGCAVAGGSESVEGGPDTNMAAAVETGGSATAIGGSEEAIAPEPGVLWASRGLVAAANLDGAAETLAGVHEHPLRRTDRATEWRCDGCHATGRGARYRSTGNGADFDLCQSCWDGVRRFVWRDERRTAPQDSPIVAAVPAGVDEGGERSFGGSSDATAAAAAAGVRGERSGLAAMGNQTASNLNERWRHTGWVASTAVRRDAPPAAGFAYLACGGDFLLASQAPVAVGTVVLVVRLSPRPPAPPSAAAGGAPCIVELGVPVSSNPPASVPGGGHGGTGVGGNANMEAGGGGDCGGESTSPDSPARRSSSLVGGGSNGETGSGGGGAGLGQPCHTVEVEVSPSLLPSDEVGAGASGGGGATNSDNGDDGVVVDGARLQAQPGRTAGIGTGWSSVYRLGPIEANASTTVAAARLGKEGLVAVESDQEWDAVLDGSWQVLFLYPKPVRGPPGGDGEQVVGELRHLYVMGDGKGGSKCAGDVAEVRVYDRPLTPAQRNAVAALLRRKFRIRSSTTTAPIAHGGAAAGEGAHRPAAACDAESAAAGRSGVRRRVLVERLRAAAGAGRFGGPARLDIPAWMDRYIKCFEVVDSMRASRPLPAWFASEIEPPPSPTVPPSSANVDGSSGGPASSPTVTEALFDSGRCGSSASLDTTRMRVEFSGMATVLFTTPLPPEGLHSMEFDVLGRDQCLVGIATPDVDVETYLGNRRGGYGFFASEGTLKVDGDWKGGHGLTRYRRGERVGVHVDMTRRTLQFSVSRLVTDDDATTVVVSSRLVVGDASTVTVTSDAGVAATTTGGGGAAGGRAGRWVTTMLERVVEGVPAAVHFAAGGAAGGQLQIAGGSVRASAPEERLGRADAGADGGYDNGNWPADLDEQLVRFLNEKAAEHRKHPRNMRADDLLRAPDAPSPAVTATAPNPTATSESSAAASNTAGGGAAVVVPVAAARRGRVEEVALLSRRASRWDASPDPSSGGEGEAGDAVDTAAADRPAAAVGDTGTEGSATAAAGDDTSVLCDGGNVDGASGGVGAGLGDALGGRRSAGAVRARFVVLKRLESLTSAALPLVDLARAAAATGGGGTEATGSAAARLVAVKGRLFEATKMHVWDAALRVTQDRKEDIPSVTLYRGPAAVPASAANSDHPASGGGNAAGRPGRAGSGTATVFSQLFAALEDAPLLRCKSKGKGLMAWQVSFAGEGGDDYGGLFRESIRELAADLQGPDSPLFILAPNCRRGGGGVVGNGGAGGGGGAGEGEEVWVPNSLCRSPLHVRQFRFLGKIMGAGMRTGNPVGLDLARLFWRRLLGELPCLADLAEIDGRFARAVEDLRAADDPDAFAAFSASSAAVHLCGAPPHAAHHPSYAAAQSAPSGAGGGGALRWAVRLASGRVVELVRGGRGRAVGYWDRRRFAEAALRARLREFDHAVAWIKQGLAANVPDFILPLLTTEEVSLRVCGEATVDLSVLRGIVKNRLQGGDANPAFGWLWEALESFTHEERRQFLGFVWGRERLPRDTTGLQLEVRTQSSQGDEHLPSSHTCFNALDLPKYSSAQVLREKLRYAIAHCKAIDADFAARSAGGSAVAAASSADAGGGDDDDDAVDVGAAASSDADGWAVAADLGDTAVTEFSDDGEWGEFDSSVAGASVL